MGPNGTELYFSPLFLDITREVLQGRAGEQVWGAKHITGGGGLPHSQAPQPSSPNPCFRPPLPGLRAFLSERGLLSKSVSPSVK